MGWFVYLCLQDHELINPGIIALWFAPYLIASSIILWRVLAEGGDADARFVFTTITTVRNRLTISAANTEIPQSKLLSDPLTYIADLSQMAVMGWVSAQRLESFLREPETNKYDVLKSSTDSSTVEDAVELRGVSAHWQANSFQLKNITANFGANNLHVIGGAVGSGKSSLLALILGEMQYSGHIRAPAAITRSQSGIVSKAVAFCAQTP